MAKPIYLDYNGTTPHAPEVIEAMLPFLKQEFGNPSSNHWFGIAPKIALREARKQVANLINCDSDEIVFTSGGTESNNHAIQGTAFEKKQKGNHIITSSIEHPAVFEVCKYLDAYGFETSYLPVDKNGLVSPEDVEQAIRPETILITIMHSNNEVGTVQPISKISIIARKHSIIMHTDAAQSVGKVKVDVEQLGVDLLSIAGHKLYGPKGVGALFIRRGTKLTKYCHGAGQENGWRAGTENVLEIVGLGKACEIAAPNLQKSILYMQSLRDRLHKGLTMSLGDTVALNGHPNKRLPNTLSLCFKKLDANHLLEEVGHDIAVSAGAACHADTIELSHVLKAMQVPEEWGKGALRFTVGRMTTESEIDRAIEVMVAAVNKLRESSRVRI